MTAGSSWQLENRRRVECLGWGANPAHTLLFSALTGPGRFGVSLQADTFGSSAQGVPDVHGGEELVALAKR